jgi:hypothetical protein
MWTFKALIEKQNIYEKNYFRFGSELCYISYFLKLSHKYFYLFNINVQYIKCSGYSLMNNEPGTQNKRTLLKATKPMSSRAEIWTEICDSFFKIPEKHTES